MTEETNIFLEDPTTELEEQEELPSYLQEQQDEPSEWSIPMDPELAANPDIARRLEEHQAGINKLVERAKEYEQTAKTTYEPYIRMEQALQDPETAWETLKHIQDYVEKTHGKVDPDTSRYGLDFVSDDKVVEVAESAAVEKLKKELKDEIEFVRSLRTKATIETESQKVLPTLQKEFGTWVTPEMLSNAAYQKPGMAIEDAFKITYARDIAKNAAEYAASRTSGRKGVPNGSPIPRTSPKEYDELGFKTNVSFFEILQEQDL